MTDGGRGSYHHGALRDALLTAAREILEEEGLEALSWRGIARRANVSHQAPYNHFADKAELLRAVADQGFSDLNQAMRSRIEAAGEGGARLRAAGVGYVVFAAQNPALFHLMFSPGLGPHPPDLSLETDRARAYAALLDAVKSYGPPPADERAARLRSLAAWSLAHGLAELVILDIARHREFGFEDLEAFAAAAIG